MQSTVRIIGSLLLLSSALASYHSAAKLRRDGVLNLYPFPRVGRASRQTWQVPPNELLTDYEPIEKRQLYAFPRVGRGEAPEAARRSDAITAMWFGPRLGRSYKGDDDEITIQNGSADHNEPEQYESSLETREKRQVKLL